MKQQEVSPAHARSALDIASAKQGADYLWGGNGPEEFDCSGLVVWAYQQALGRRNLYFDGTYQVDDVNMQTFFDYNVRLIGVDEVVPGDLIFITDDEYAISHGGLVVAVKDTAVEFVNASSYFDQVVVDEWSLSETVRGQWIEAFGRLKVCGD